MKSLTQTLVVVMVVLLGCVSTAAQETKLSPAERGRSDAARDVKKKEFVIKAWGLGIVSVGGIPSRADLYESLLLTRYRIRYDWVGGCVISDETRSYARAYNEVSIAAIERKFGKGFLERARKEADKEYEANGYAERAREYNQKFRDAVQQLPKKDN